ncbi:MAG: glutathione S-transferase family protein [Candidatus Binataceae bacterium]
MGLLVKGEWKDQWYDTGASGGRFIRSDAAFRNWVTRDGEPGPNCAGGFKAEPGRYHLYVSLACPWAHRTLIVRRLKRLEEAISVSVVDPFMGERGWAFTSPDGSITPGSTADDINGAKYLYEVYARSLPDYSGRVTVPVLWDKQRAMIVNNESSEIIVMLNSAFDQWGDARVDLYPAPLRDQIDHINATVYDNVNNGVYKCGFATRQDAYEQAFDALFTTLNELERRLARIRYLVGDRPTLADWRLFTTLVRFDAVYYSHFKCNLRRLMDYPNLWGFACDLYQTPGVADTVNLAQIKRHYYMSHPTINPTRIVPKGPALDFTVPHDRARLSR